MAVKTQTKKLTSLEENLAFLRKILSVDTLLDEINQEEALEFLSSIESDIASEKEAIEDEIKDLKEEIRIKGNEYEELEKEKGELEEKLDFALEINTIKYETSNIMDDYVMEALGEAYQKLPPFVIIERLKVA